MGAGRYRYAQQLLGNVRVRGGRAGVPSEGQQVAPMAVSAEQGTKLFRVLIADGTVELLEPHFCNLRGSDLLRAFNQYCIHLLSLYSNIRRYVAYRQDLQQF